MNELMEDVTLLCPKCAPKPDPRIKKEPLHEFVGKLCKMAFPCEVGQVTTEHMWVRCVGAAKKEGEELRGKLDNDPVLVTELRRGDWVEFSRSDIEAVI